MKYSFILFFTFYAFLSFGQSSDEKKDFVIIGKVHKPKSKMVVLSKTLEDPRSSGIEIPIKSDGTFEYKLENSIVEAYRICFKEELEEGSWKYAQLYNDTDTIRVEMYAREDSRSNQVMGSKLSSKKLEYGKLISQKFYDALNAVSDKIYTLEQKKNIQEDKLKALKVEEASIYDKMYRWQLDYIQKNPDLSSYVLFLGLLHTLDKKGDMERYPVFTCLQLLTEKFPEHPYTKIANTRLGARSIMVGKNYVDFTVPNLAGKPAQLSEVLAKNKFVLIDLWKPWCGPCIRKSKKVIPVYKKYKDKGFEVFAVVGTKSQEEFKKLIKRYKYPWQSFADIQDQNQIWEKYGIPNYGGSQFLVNNEGKILGINLKPEEIVRILEGK